MSACIPFESFTSIPFGDFVRAHLGYDLKKFIAIENDQVMINPLVYLKEYMRWYSRNG